NASIDDVQVAISGAFEDSGWPTTAQTGKVAVYGLFDSLMKEVGGVGNKALVGTAEDIFEALRKGINENRYNLGDKTRDIKAAYAFFEDINDVKNFQTEATFDFYRGKIFEAENKLRLTDSFITAFSPLREWKSIMCPAIGEKLDCNISDMYAAVVTNIEQGQDLTDQIRFLFGMPKNSSLKDRYIGLLKALKDLVEMTKDMNKTCGVGEVLDAIKTEGLTDTYIYTQVKQQEFWQVNLMYEDELKKILQENSERQANPKIDSGLNYKKEKEIGKAVTK
ncbi:MAG: hypothetical protein J6Y94_06060, partial [Bacteriovoracaceae bacterium]|nr:hypothetical protein [Bacteriovoracaceae bacterium]